MALSIEELAERLDMEIAARKLLERKLSAQSGSISNVETRLSSQIQTAVSTMESRMKSTEGVVENESLIRADGDDLLHSAQEDIKSSLSTEEAARIASDDSLKQQIESNESALILLQSRVDNCESDISANATGISDETQERVGQYEYLDLNIQNAKSELEQQITDVRGALDNASLRADSLDEKIEAESNSLKEIESKGQLNAEEIQKVNQRVDGLTESINQFDDKFLDETAVSNMINDSFVEAFAGQMQTIRDVLAEEQAAREVDIANIQDYAARAQNASNQAKSIFDYYQQTIKDSAKSMRDAFNLLLPKGTILPYYGDLAAIPDGWKLCNGAYDTPDLVGKVLVGAHAVAEDEEAGEFTLGKEGGEKEVSLNSNNMPAHYHFTGTMEETNKGAMFINNGKATFKDVPVHKKLWGARTWDGCGEASYIHSNGMLQQENETVNTITSGQVIDGVSKPHSNMQPYYCIYYIMKMF